MKKIITIFLLVLPLMLPAQEVIDWAGIIDRYIEKYQPAEMPQWLFPLVFENGFGERDTLYLGYDKDSDGGNFEVKYGEAYIPVDSSEFKAYWFQCPSCDSLTVMDNKITSGITTIGSSVSFLNGKMPITVHYNDAFFYSDSLAGAHPTFPSESPYVQGEAREDNIGVALGRWNKIEEEWETSCGWANTLALMDSTPWGVAMPNCSIMPDSFHINDETPDVFNYSYGFSFTIKTWTGQHVGTQELKENSLTSYPNPCDQFFFVDLPHSMSGLLTLSNTSGVIEKRQRFDTQSQLVLDTSSLLEGIYFLKIESEEGTDWYGKTLVRHL